MRHNFFLSAMVGLVAVAAPAFGQTYPAEAVILQNEVEVRSGPSQTFFPTSKLLRNDRVLVLREAKEAPGWLEIKPPPGSFSWINARHVKFAKQGDRLGSVDGDPARPVSILPGSTLVNKAPDRESIKLTAGTIVVLVNPPLQVNGETWLPIQPHPSEVRYIPSDAVRPTQTVTATASAPNWTLANGAFLGNSVLAQAEQALKDNDVNRARYLYQQVANNATDQNQKVYAMNRLSSLPQSPLTPGQTTSLQKSAETRAGFSPATPAAGALQQLNPAAWTTYGRLRDTKMTREDGQPIYTLEDGQGKALAYVTTLPGKSLQSYLGRMVAVYGPTMYRPDSAVRIQYVVASHVAVP